MKPVLVRLPEGVPERIDALVGKNKRAEFIREAVLQALTKRESSAAKGAPSSNSDDNTAE